MSDEKTKKRQRDTGEMRRATKAARKPDRGKVKRNPTSIKELVASLQAGTLDGRSREALQFKAVQDALGDDPLEVAKALLRYDVATCAVITRNIVEAVQASGGIIKDGALDPNITKDLPKFQMGMCKAIDCLMRLEGKTPTKQPGQGGVLDVASIVMADNQGDNHD